jgi:hypothetical protein
MKKRKYPNSSSVTNTQPPESKGKITVRESPFKTLAMAGGHEFDSLGYMPRN